MRTWQVLALAAVLGLGGTWAWSAPQKIVIDSDGYADYDDVVAFMVAAVSPEVDLLGVVVTGDDGEGRARTAAKALALVGRDDVGVYVGEKPGSPPPDFPYMAQFPPRRYGMRPQIERWAAGFPFVRPATSGADFYRGRILQAPGEISVIVQGPLSTLARAMAMAEEGGEGAAFRGAVRQILFSGGDFKTVEYNVYTDVAAARRVFASGVPIVQFGGEGPDKAYLTHEWRERLWQAGTPTTWALQDLYRLYGAGWDPTSPFVPILYDVHPVAFLIAGAAISGFEPARVDVDDVGHLRRVAGPPNATVRVVNHPARLLALVVERLADPIRPGINHLRRIAQLAGERAPAVAAAAAQIADGLAGGAGADRAAVGPELAALDSRLPALGPDAPAAREHLDLARRFLLGDPRADPWRDPFTPRFIALAMPFYEAVAIVTNRRTVPVEVTAVVLVVTAVLWRRRRRRAAAD